MVLFILHFCPFVVTDTSNSPSQEASACAPYIAIAVGISAVLVIIVTLAGSLVIHIWCIRRHKKPAVHVKPNFSLQLQVTKIC